MFKSLKNWMDLPVTIKPTTGRSGAGSKLFGASFTAMCYAEGKVQIVKNSQGKEIVSHKQLYLDGTVAIKELDTVLFENYESDVQAIGYYYRKGVVDIKVVYL